MLEEMNEITKVPLAELPTEARNPKSEHIDELSTLEMLRVINDEDMGVAAAVRKALSSIAESVDAITIRFETRSPGLTPS